MSSPGWRTRGFRIVKWGEMVTIEVKGEVVEVEVLGIHKLWALKSRLRFKKSNITKVGMAEKSLRPPLIKIPGTYLPGIIAAGTFRGRSRNEFWDVVFKNDAVEIELTNEKYTRVVVNVRDPMSVMKLLRAAS
jgi:hypothetical protein